MTFFKQRVLIIISVVMIILNNSLPCVYSSDETTYVFDDKEARAFLGFMYNTNTTIIYEEDLSENDIYKLLTGQYENNSQEECIAKISFLSTLYEMIDNNISDQTNTMNATRAHLLEYLENQLPDDYSQYIADSIINAVIKSAWKCVLYDICKWDVDLVNDIELIYNSIKDIQSIPAKANKYVENVHAAIVAGIDVVSSNKANMYLYFREYVNANVSMGEYADTYMSAFDLSLSGKILAYDPILNWHSEDNLETLKRWAKYVADIELSLTTTSHETPSYNCKFSLNYPFADDIICYTAQDTVNFLASSQAQPTRDGYTFDWWYLDAACTTPWTNGEIEEGQTFYAKWKKIDITTYKITFDSNSPDISDYSYIFNPEQNNWIDNYEMERPGYVFAGWYWDSACANPVSGDITINKDLVFYAKWLQQFEYTVSNGCATITKFLGFAQKDGAYITDIEIPSSIDGYPIICIGKSSFANFVDITSIKISNGITTIDDSAFYDCDALKNVIIPESVISIGKNAFSFCSSLQGINIPNSVKTIGNSAFYASGLKSIVIPDSITTISSSLFYGCGRLNNVTIPNSVTTIENQAFRACGLTSITIPDSVKSIEFYAFAWCDSLKKVVLGSGVTTIGSSAFCSCDSLTHIDIPENVEVIGSGAFSLIDNLLQINVSVNNPNYSSENGILFNKNKTTLIQYPSGKTNSSYTIPDGVNTISSEAFYNCKFSEINIPDSITDIKSSAFNGCSNLINVEIPNGVKIINKYAFKLCTALTTVKLPDSIVSIDYEAFAGCWELKNIVIPYAVQSIGYSAFSFCKNLNQINIPDSVTQIEEYAFRGCSSLADIYYNGTKNQWEQMSINSLNNDSNSATINYNSRKVTFDANGGITNVTNKYVTHNSKYGELPTPTRTEYIFNGWYTEPIGGTQITSDTNVTAEADHTLYAQWTKVEPYTKSTVKGYDHTDDAYTDEKFVYVVDTELYNSSDDCIIIVAGYNNGRMETVTIQSSTQEDKNFRLQSDVAIDEIKVMLWNNISLMKPLCRIESIIDWEMWHIASTLPLF